MPTETQTGRRIETEGAEETQSRETAHQGKRDNTERQADKRSRSCKRYSRNREEKKEGVSEEVGEGPGCDGPETLFYGLSEASLLPDTA